MTVMFDIDVAKVFEFKNLFWMYHFVRIELLVLAFDNQNV